jgi:hypothetical protein
VAQEDTRRPTSAFISSKLVEAYFEHGYAEEAEAYVAAIGQQRGRNYGYQNVAAHYARQGQLKRAYDIVAQQLPAPWKEVTLKRMADACARQCRVSEFRDIAARMSNEQYRDQATGNLVDALTQAGRDEEARELAATISDSRRQARAKARISGGLAGAADRAQLSQRIREAKDREEKLALYRQLFQLQNEARDIAGAEATIQQMVETIQASPLEAKATKFGRSDDAGALAGVRALYLVTARTLADSGDRQTALQHLRKAHTAIVALDKETGLAKTLLVNQLVATQLTFGDLAGVRELLPLVEIDHTRAMTARSLAIAYIGQGNLTAAREVARLITTDVGRGNLVGDVAAAFIAAHEPFLARELLITLDETEEDSQAYRTVARKMIELGMHAGLVDLLDNTPSPIACAYACIGAAEQLQRP